MDELVVAAERLASNRVYLFFKAGSHFQNPLVSRERLVLEKSAVTDDPGIRRVVFEILGEKDDLERGIYSPVPIARGLEAGGDEAELLGQFRYEMIRVDDEQQWWWQGKTVAPKVRAFFTEHLSFEPELDLYFFEYRVSDDWWDKSYFESQVTPMLARSIEEEAESAWVQLNNGRRDRLDLETLRLDDRERLFCRSETFGEVLFVEAVRFSLLRTVAEDFQSILVAGRHRPLAWPGSVGG